MDKKTNSPQKALSQKSLRAVKKFDPSRSTHSTDCTNSLELEKPTPSDHSYENPDCENVPPRFVNKLKLAYAGKLSPRKAIQMKCFSCVGFENVRQEISACGIKRCPLFLYRPYQKERESK